MPVNNVNKVVEIVENMFDVLQLIQSSGLGLHFKYFGNLSS